MGAPKFALDQNDSFLQQTGRLEIHEKRGDRLISLTGQLAVDKNVVPEVDLRHAPHRARRVCGQSDSR